MYVGVSLTPRCTPTTILADMASEKSEAAHEWGYAGRSLASMYGSFFYWLFREPFPVRHPVVLVVSMLGVCIATLATNIAANVVSPAN